MWLVSNTGAESSGRSLELKVGNPAYSGSLRVRVANGPTGPRCQIVCRQAGAERHYQSALSEAEFEQLFQEWKRRLHSRAPTTSPGLKNPEGHIIELTARGDGWQDHRIMGPVLPENSDILVWLLRSDVGRSLRAVPIEQQGSFSQSFLKFVRQAY